MKESRPLLSGGQIGHADISSSLRCKLPLAESSVAPSPDTLPDGPSGASRSRSPAHPGVVVSERPSYML